MARFSSLQYEKDFGDVYAMLEGMEHELTDESLAEFSTKEVYPYLREKALNRFPTHGEDIGPRWSALRESTQERRARAGYGGADPINIRTGALEQYIDDATPDVFMSGGAVLLVYPGDMPSDPETERKYTTAQQGRMDRSRTSPRPIIGFATEDYAWIRGRLELHIMRGGAAS